MTAGYVIIVDDPQSNKDVKTDRAVKDAWNWFQDEVIYSLAKRWVHPHFNKTYYGKIRFLGTSLHPSCIAERVYRDGRFVTKRYGILMNEDGEPDIVNGKSIWEEMFPTAELYKEMKEAEQNGDLGNWLQERMNMPYKYGDRVFNVDDTRYWDIGGNKFDIIAGQPVLVMEEDLGLNLGASYGTA